MDETAAEPRRRIPTVREATEFESAAFLFDGKGGVKPVDFDHQPVSGPDKGFILVAGSLSSPTFRSWIRRTSIRRPPKA